MRSSTATSDEVRELTREEGHTLFDENVRQLLGISSAEFLVRWDRGDYASVDDPDVASIAMLMPFAR